jgi:hypothetical protein
MHPLSIGGAFKAVEYIDSGIFFRDAAERFVIGIL